MAAHWGDYTPFSAGIEKSLRIHGWLASGSLK
jgi:hypothetical protein